MSRLVFITLANANGKQVTSWRCRFDFQFLLEINWSKVEFVLNPQTREATQLLLGYFGQRMRQNDRTWPAVIRRSTNCAENTNVIMVDRSAEEIDYPPLRISATLLPTASLPTIAKSSFGLWPCNFASVTLFSSINGTRVAHVRECVQRDQDPSRGNLT